MLLDTNIRALRRHYRFDSAEEAKLFLAAIARRSEPGMATAVALDHRRRLLEFRPVADGAEHLPDVLLFMAFCGRRGTRSLFLVTDRTGEVPADRPDDELQWEELVGLARSLRLQLLDWWVTVDQQAFSIAEFAPTPAGW